MRRSVSPAAVVLIVLGCVAARAAAAEPVRYILDTDLASDCDDAAAMAVMHALADRGEAELLAVMVSTGGQYGAPAACAINTWYGRGDLPVGTLKDPTFWVGGGPDKPAGASNYESYNRRLSERFPTRIKRGDDAPDARVLYRKVLAAQPDGSVVINSDGPLINLRLLMQTKGDEHSPLDGKALIRAKVKTLVVAGGRQPKGTSSNFSKAGAGAYAKPVIDGWPAPVVFVGNDVGHEVKTGWGKNRDATEGNPAREAYKLFYRGNDTKKHHTADQAGVLFAIRGTGDLFDLVGAGHLQCDEKGMTQWVDDPDPPGVNHAHVKRKPDSDQQLVDTVEELMTQPRRANAAR